MPEDEVAAKFRDCAQFARWPADRTEKIISLVLDLEKTNDIRALTGLLHADS
jgi:hypothetical protein